MGWAYRGGVGSLRWGGFTEMEGALTGWGGLTEMGWAHRDGASLALEREGQGLREGEHPRLKSTEADCFVWPFRSTMFSKS